MGHPWDKLFYRFKGLGNCISKLVKNHGVSYDTINERNPLAHATTPLWELPTIEVIQDPTSGTYTRKVCMPMIGTHTILRKGASGNTIPLRGASQSAKLLISRKFGEEVKPIVPLTCEWDAQIEQYRDFKNYAEINFEVGSGNFEGNAIFFGANRKTTSVGSWNFVDFIGGNVVHGGDPTYTLVEGINGTPVDSYRRLVLVTDNVFSDSATFPVEPYSSVWGILSNLKFSQSWRGTQLGEEIVSRLGLTPYATAVSYDGGSARGEGALSAFVESTKSWGTWSVLRDTQWEAILAKNPWAGNWYLNGQFVMSVGHTNFSISAGYYYLEEMDVDVGDRASLSESYLNAFGSGISETEFWQTYAQQYDDDERIIRLQYNADVPQVKSLNLIGQMSGYITATEGGKIFIKVKASDRWKGASASEREACYWETYYPHCWVDSNVETVSVNGWDGVGHLFTKVETLGSLSKWELRSATPNDILGAENDSMLLEVLLTGQCNRIGAQNWAELYANDNWAYNLVNVDATETCSYKHWY